MSIYIWLVGVSMDAVDTFPMEVEVPNNTYNL